LNDVKLIPKPNEISFDWFGSVYKPNIYEEEKKNKFSWFGVNFLFYEIIGLVLTPIDITIYN